MSKQRKTKLFGGFLWESSPNLPPRNWIAKPWSLKQTQFAESTKASTSSTRTRVVSTVPTTRPSVLPSLASRRTSLVSRTRSASLEMLQHLRSREREPQQVFCLSSKDLG